VIQFADIYGLWRQQTYVSRRLPNAVVIIVATKHVDRFQLSKALKFEPGGTTQNSLIDLEQLGEIQCI